MNRAGLEAEEVTGYRCEECGAFSAEPAEEPLYECGGCGDRFTGRRCESCNRFARKVAENACAACEAAEVEEVPAVRCQHCGDVLEPEAFPAHDCREAVRKAQETSAAAAAERERKLAAALAAMQARPVRVQFEQDKYGEPGAGDILVNGIEAGRINDGWVDPETGADHEDGASWNMRGWWRGGAGEAMFDFHGIPREDPRFDARCDSLEAARAEAEAWLREHLPPDTICESGLTADRAEGS